LKHREHLMRQLPTAPGRRLLAWWQYDAPGLGLRWPGYDRERSTLYEAGLLADEEKAELLADWRQAFDKAQRLDLGYCIGPGRWLTGERARRAYYAWVDIPAELVQKWTEEHQRRAKTIRNLAAGVEV
jgi:hypothetical protein